MTPKVELNLHPKLSQRATHASTHPMPPPGLLNGIPTTPLPATPSATEPSIQNASTLASIQSILSNLHTRDAAITSRLQSLISSQASLSRDLGRLDLLRAHLGTNVIHTRAISNGMLDNAASTAEKLSSKVKELDLEKKRVEETLGVVDQVAELKACVNGVVGSMGAPQDWEAAAGYIARASKVPQYIVEGNFAARTVPSVEVPDAPGTTLEAAKESLCGLFLREFEKAAAENDGVKVTRFFKLFPLIGREDTGLDVYGRYVCQGVAGIARKNLKEGTSGARGKEGFFYAQALTRLFEHIAQIVEGHGGLVERHYGVGRMVRVIERLQVEADVQGGIILDTWGDEKNVDRRLTDVKSYPFSFLVQSFLPNQRPSGLTRTGSPAVGGTANGRASEDEGVDMKEVDGLLSEMAVMLGRWSLYSRFLAGKCRVSPTPKPVLQQAISKLSQDQEASPDDPLIMPDLLVKSALSRKISNRLKDPFNVMTMFFFRRSVEKAFQLDESPTGLSLNPSKPIDGNGPYIISAVDDVMYIVNTVLQRSISTSQRGVMESVIPTIGRVLGSDFVGMIQRKMRDESYPKPVVQNGFPPEDKIVAFIVLINSLDVANDYISRIVTTRLQTDTHSAALHKTNPPQALSDLFPFNHDATFVSNALLSLNSSFSTKTTELITEGLRVLFINVVKPRLRPVLSETFRDIDYTLSANDLAELARQSDAFSDDPVDLADLVHRRFDQHWNALMNPIQRIMQAGPYLKVLQQTAEYLASWLERRMWSLAKGRMDEVGMTRMERDFGGVVGVVCRGNYGLRDTFARVTQLAMLMTMEEEEWEAVDVDVDVGGAGNREGGGEGVDGDEGEGDGEPEMVWVLSVEERRRARALISAGVGGGGA